MKLPFAILIALAASFLTFAAVFCLATILFSQLTPVERNSSEDSIMGPLPIAGTMPQESRQEVAETVQPTAPRTARLQQPVLDFPSLKVPEPATLSPSRVEPKFQPAGYSEPTENTNEMPELEMPAQESAKAEPPSIDETEFDEIKFELVTRETEIESSIALPMASPGHDERARPIVVKSQPPVSLWDQLQDLDPGKLVTAEAGKLLQQTEVNYASDADQISETDDGQWLRSLLDNTADQPGDPETSEEAAEQAPGQAAPELILVEENVAADTGPFTEKAVSELAAPLEIPQQVESSEQKSGTPESQTPESKPAEVMPDPQTLPEPQPSSNIEEPSAPSTDSQPKRDDLTDPAKTLTITDQHAQANQPSPPVPAKPESSELPPQEVAIWPLPDSLMGELEHLAQYHFTQLWADAALSTYQHLNRLPLSHPDGGPLLAHCHQLADQLAQHGSQLAISEPSQMESAVYLTRIAYKMKRRAAICHQVHQVAMQNIAETDETSPGVIADQIVRRCNEIGWQTIDPRWTEYLMLDEAREVFANPRSSAARRQAIARKIMERVTSRSLTAEQVQYAQETIGNDLGHLLRSAALARLDLVQFLKDMERFEAQPTSGSEARFNSHFQNYFWSRHEEVQKLADIITDHYRNANVRIEVTQDMINRMVPRNQTINQPVRDRILGAAVFGESRVTNQLQVQLIPDADHLSFRLLSNGRVISNTQARASGFVFSNIGNALVNASKSIAIGEEGVQYRPASVQASAMNRLTGVQSRLDNVPVVGWVARRVAEQQQQAQSPQAKIIVEQRLRNEVRTRVDSEIQQRVAQAEQWLQTNLLGPLNSMELEPTPVSLATTDHSAIVRYRLASLDQLGANTPRPQPQPGSLFSVQMHRSAINNLISRMEIGGRTFTAPEFMQHLNTMLGRTDLQLQPGEHENVTLEFASREPVRLDFDKGRILISLRLRKLQIERQNRWRNLIVTAAYTPQVSPDRVFMTIDDEHGITLQGHRLNLRDQLTIRTAFSALFKPQFNFPLLPPDVATQPAIQGLGISELLASDGWLGVSFSQVSPVTAARGPQPADQAQQPHQVPHSAHYRSPWERRGRWR